MVTLPNRLATELAKKGINVTVAFPSKRFTPELAGPRFVIGVEAVRCEAPGLDDALYRAQGGVVRRGWLVRGTLFLESYCSYPMPASRDSDAMSLAVETALQKLTDFTVGAIRLDPPRYDAGTDCFRHRLSIALSAYLYQAT